MGRYYGVLLGLTVWTLCGPLYGGTPPATPAEPVSGTASAHLPVEHLRHYSDLAVTWMQEYLRLDTTNPPGNEMRAVAFYKKILDEEGIENRAFEFTPGRGDLWARIPHTTSEAKRPIILLNHTDVVTRWPARRGSGRRCVRS